MDVGNCQLRRAVRCDADAIHALFCVPQVYAFLADGQAPPPEVARAWIESAPSDQARLGGGLWALAAASGQDLHGLARLAGDANGGLELTYLLHPDVWGHGLATRMAHTVMEQAFNARKATTVWAGADVPNAASIAVMQRLGMTFRRDVQHPMGPGVEYRMTADDFEPTRIESLPISSLRRPQCAFSS